MGRSAPGASWRPTGDRRIFRSIGELASFLPIDPDLLVRASLACPRCLNDVEWEVRGASEDAEAHCTCPRCGASRDLYLSPEQALRLRIGGGLTSEGVPIPEGDWPR